MPIGALIPPLVAKIRREVKEWRDSGYVGASDTSQALLWWWFQEPHHAENGGEFRYYFSQQEAMESIIYLYEVKAGRKISTIWGVLIPAGNLFPLIYRKLATLCR